jgi:hypothetical protein
MLVTILLILSAGTGMLPHPVPRTIISTPISNKTTVPTNTTVTTLQIITTPSIISAVITLDNLC